MIRPHGRERVRVRVMPLRSSADEGVIRTKNRGREGLFPAAAAGVCTQAMLVLRERLRNAA